MTWIGDMFSVLINVRRDEAEGIISLELVAIDGAPLPPFEAGAHIDVVIDNGLIRQYSICNNPAEKHIYRLGILLEPTSRGGSRGIHMRFAVGDIVRISRPRNNFRLQSTASRSVLLGGGIGVTPLLGMAYRLHAAGADFDLHYCTRSQNRTAFFEELLQGDFAGRVHIYHDDGPETQRFSLADTLGGPDEGKHLYVCGPRGFMDFVTSGAAALGWTNDRIHIEYFGADIERAGSSFELVANRSGRAFTIGANDTIAKVLLANGIDVVLSCEQGVCGTCLTRVVDGVPDHRDLYQNDTEKAANSHITLCCSRALTPRLVVDI